MIAASKSHSKTQLLGNAKKIGNYILGKKIGAGSFGHVYLGLHLKTGERVAIKIIQKSKIKVRSYARIKDQIKIMSENRHYNLVHLYEIIQTNNSLLLIMQYLPKGQLYGYISRNKKLMEGQAKIYFLQLLRVIKYLHQNQIVHRDIKPANIMMDYDNTIKLIDFGLATYSDQFVHTICGSPYYAAPQVMMGKEYDPIKADIWSCGVVLYVMLCGKLPKLSKQGKINNKWQKGKKQSIFFEKDHNQQLPSYLSSTVVDLIQKILKNNPNQRITLQEILNHELFKQTKSAPIYGVNKYQYIQPDVNLIKQVIQMGYKENDLRNSLQNNKKNQQSATYYILMKKKIKEGQQISSYIACDHFDHQLIKQKSIIQSCQDPQGTKSPQLSPFPNAGYQQEQAQRQIYKWLSTFGITQIKTKRLEYLQQKQIDNNQIIKIIKVFIKQNIRPSFILSQPIRINPNSKKYFNPIKHVNQQKLNRRIHYLKYINLTLEQLHMRNKTQQNMKKTKKSLKNTSIYKQKKNKQINNISSIANKIILNNLQLPNL